MDNYSRLVERIASSSNLSGDDVERKIEAKRAKLSGLISKEGAAQIIAAELGISFDNELLKIGELVEGMKRAHVIGKITQLFPIRTYEKNGRSGKIGSFLLGDVSSNIRTVLWDAHHIELIEAGTLTEGSVIEILNGGVRNGELHLGAFSDLKMSAEQISDVKMSRALNDMRLQDAKPGMYARIRATIVQLFDPKYFDDKRNPGQRRALVTFVLDDGTETMRCLVNDRVLSTFGFAENDFSTIESFAPKKQELLGEELSFVGSFKTNTYFNRLEFSVERMDRIDPVELIKTLDSN